MSAPLETAVDVTAVDVAHSEQVALELLGGREGWAALKERGRADRLTPTPEGFGVSFTDVEGAHRWVCVAREANGTYRVSLQRMNMKPRATALFDEERSETALTLEEARRLVWLETGVVRIPMTASGLKNRETPSNQNPSTNRDPEKGPI